MASPSPIPITGGQPLSPGEDDSGARRQDRAASAVRDVDDPAIDAALDAVVESAPPLPYEVRARLAWLLRGQHHRSRRDNAA